MIVLCSRLRRSNIRTLPSAPQLTKTSTLPAQKRTSKTSLSCAISCVLAVRDGISHMVHVVSMLEVMISFGDMVFQSNEVKGAVCSGVLEFDRSASGVSFGSCGSRVFTEDDRVMVLLIVFPEFCGRDHNRKWSPEVARRSVDCFCDDGGSHRIRVTGKEHVASAMALYSRPKGDAPGPETSWGVICVSRMRIYMGSELAPKCCVTIRHIQSCGCLQDSFQWPSCLRCCPLERSTCTNRRHKCSTVPNNCCWRRPCSDRWSVRCHVRRFLGPWLSLRGV